MISEFPKSIRLVLNNDKELGRVNVDLDSFLEFDGDISVQLESLVEEWLPHAAPNAARRDKRNQLSRG